ncbi:heavy metal-associated isoprenylated plant protein 28-like isoform X2 [Cornus florida]|uniref:heavy metal-associated isoprenylated plant protein 28-like isoform X2 n=1 Tax=Cornus florida TaxID=4283 RepID=UPI00289E767D|nr:heavy metal-associated isoprenylated plant protein 28-like isoform X2 [Cornus florida]
MQVIELKVRLHCKACEKSIRKTLGKIKDLVLNKITVLGYVDRKIVIKAVRKTGRRAEVWPSKSSCRGRQQPRGGFGCIIPRWVF